MKVIVKPYLFLRDILGFTSREIGLPDKGEKNIGELLKVIRRSYRLPDRVDIARGQLVLFEDNRPVGIVILVNGRNIGRLNGLGTLLKDGDQVTMFPPAAGG